MYVYLEQHRAASGEVVATDVAMGSRFGSLNINWNTPAEKAAFDVVRATLKTAILKERMYDEKTKVWSFIGSTGEGIRKILEGLSRSTSAIQIEEVENLVAQAKTGTIKRPSKGSPKFDPQNFYYQRSASPSAPSKESISSSLSKLFGLSEEEFSAATPQMLKQFYRRKALEFHPDRNHGDGSRMSDLNSLWTLFNA